jgi:hypothetical protein
MSDGKAASLRTVSIIGTAGRKEDGAKLNKEVFLTMCDTARRVITVDWKLAPEKVRLVSGGSAWADHVAVRLYLDSVFSHCFGDDCAAPAFGGLTLYLPCALDRSKAKAPRAVDTGSAQWQTNPGRVLNQLHAVFAKELGSDASPYADMIAAEALGAKLDCSAAGFHKRNSLVARSDYLLAFTWGTDSKQPKDGGTLDTWNKSKAMKNKRVIMRHIPLGTMPKNSASSSVPNASAAAASSSSFFEKSASYSRSHFSQSVNAPPSPFFLRGSDVVVASR